MRRLSALGIAVAVVVLATAHASEDRCGPWNPADPRVVAHDGRTLHGEPDHIRDLFYRVWGSADLERGQHIRRWRWEHDRSWCQRIEAPVTREVVPPPHAPAAPSDAGWFAGYHFPICDRRDERGVHCRINPEWPVLEWRDGDYFRCKSLAPNGRGVGCQPY